MEIRPDTLRLAQSGDPAAQAQFVRECVRAVSALIRRLGARADREDRLQEILAHLLRVLPRFDPNGPAQLGTWVHTVVYRWLLMQKRKQQVHFVPLDAAAAIPDPEVIGEALIERKQLKTLLADALGRLSDAHRQVFVMTQLHQLPLQQVADAEGISLGTVKSRLHRARAELVVVLGEALDDGESKGGADVANG